MYVSSTPDCIKVASCLLHAYPCIGTYLTLYLFDLDTGGIFTVTESLLSYASRLKHQSRKRTRIPTSAIGTECSATKVGVAKEPMEPFSACMYLFSS